MEKLDYVLENYREKYFFKIDLESHLTICCDTFLALNLSNIGAKMLHLYYVT